MRSDSKKPKRIKPEKVQCCQVTEAINIKTKEASKPLYLTRYE